MKKLLSLALALIMMLPLAIGVSAATNNSYPTAEEYLDFIKYVNWVNSAEDDYEDLLDYYYAQQGIYRKWWNSCETEGCSGRAYFYVSGGRIYYSCTVCGKTEESSLTSSDTSCSKCSCSNCDVSKTDCPCDCRKCTCGDVDPSFTVSPEVEFGGKFNHSSKACKLSDVDFYQYGKNVYWYCGSCGNSGKFSSSYYWDDDWYDYFWDYEIRVYCTTGGSYEISDSRYADHGDTRTVTFEPNYGYVLYNVTVNGKEYGAASTLNLTVTNDIVIRAEFVKASSLKSCDLTASAIGNGTITAKKNGVAVDASEITARYSDTVTYTFKPASSNYAVKDVTVNGRSVGSVNSYSVSKGITKDIDIKVTFEWKNPYNDVSDNYLKAVEYVTEAGIMGYYNMYVNKNAFGGTKELTVKAFAAALAEMADISEKLDTVDERIAWAEKNGIVDGNADLSVICNVQAACDIVDRFIRVLEENGDIRFEDFDDEASAEENALSIDLVTANTYAKNRSITRYDLAAICYLVANLEVE